MSQEIMRRPIDCGRLRSDVVWVFVVKTTIVFVTFDAINDKLRSARLQTKINTTTNFVDLYKTEANRP